MHYIYVEKASYRKYNINLNHNSYTIVDAKISSTLPSQLFGL